MVKKKNDYIEEFLIEFKNLENLFQKLYGNGTTFRDVEQKLSEENTDSILAKKMQICRIIRNYASHNSDLETFLPLSKETYDFICQLYKEFEKKMLIVKECMSRVKPLSVKDNISYAAQRLAKISSMPVVDESGMLIGIFDLEVLRKCVADELSMKTKLGKDAIRLKTSYFCITQYVPADKIDTFFNDTNVLFVTSDGKKNGKYIGLIQK